MTTMQFRADVASNASWARSFLHANGFAPVLAPNGARALGRPIHIYGHTLFAAMLDKDREAPPACLTTAVWVGYYEGPALREMHGDEEFESVMDFLARHWRRFAPPNAPLTFHKSIDGDDHGCR